MEQVECCDLHHHTELHAGLRYGRISGHIQKGREDHTTQAAAHSASESGDSFPSRPGYTCRDFRGRDEVEERDDERNDCNEYIR